MQVLKPPVYNKKYEREKDIEKRANILIKREHPTVIHRKMNGFGFRSWPDRLYLFDNEVEVWIEYKKPGEVPSPGQKELHRQLRAQGRFIFVCDDPVQALIFCQAAIAEASIKRPKKK